jgi:hypothetical protein
VSHTLLHDEDLAVPVLLGASDAVDEAMGESAMASALWARASTVAAESRARPRRGWQRRYRVLLKITFDMHMLWQKTKTECHVEK